MYPQRVGCSFNSIPVNILAFHGRALIWKITVEASREAVCYTCQRPLLTPIGSWVCVFGSAVGAIGCTVVPLSHGSLADMDCWRLALKVTSASGSDTKFLLSNHLDVSELQLQIVGPHTDYSSHHAFSAIKDCNPKTVSQISTLSIKLLLSGILPHWKKIINILHNPTNKTCFNIIKAKNLKCIGNQNKS